MQRDGIVKKILIIDDNADASDGLATLLGLLGHRVEVARSGHAGLEAAIETNPEVILLDIEMPDMDGHDVATRLRARGDFGDVLIIAITGYGGESDRELSRRAGIDHHLVKPCDPENILGLLGDNPAAGTTQRRTQCGQTFTTSAPP
jgi:two-component system CheB/CheR fusion protein